MSLASLPPNGLSLHGFATEDPDPKHASNPAILFKLNKDLLEDVKKAPKGQGGLHFLTGNTPKIRIGSRTIDLTISAEAFRYELYSASTESLSDFKFAGLLGHRAELKAPERKHSVGGDAALANLQSSLASIQQEKQAKSVNISDQLVKEPRNRYEAAKDQKRRRGMMGAHTQGSPSGSSMDHQLGASATSMPQSASAERTRAMRTPLVHLLAMRPLTLDDIVRKTKIPKDEADEVLQRIGKQEAGIWRLTDRAYKELDVWKFGYSTQEDRQAAVDNAIRAYDRLRLGKDEKLWQMLLPKEDRDKGIVLSKLYLVGGASSCFLTPNAAGSGDEGDVKSAANTPRLGPSSTPKVGPGSSGSLSKRLFAKDPKKTRAAEEAKEKKRKEREVAAAANSDREAGKPVRKKQTTKTNNPKVKSEEIVHDSSDESSGDQVSKPIITGSSSQPKSSTNVKSIANATARTATPKQKELQNSKDGKDAPAKARPKATAGATPKTAGGPKTAGTPSARPAATAASKTSKPAALGGGKSTPNGGLSATASQTRPQLSSQKGGSRPRVPSPLGAARPRVASDVSDRGAVGIQRVRQGGDTPKGLGTTNGVRKRHDTITSADSGTPYHRERMNGDHAKPHKATVNGNKTVLTNGAGHKDEHPLKRKHVDSPSHEHGRSIAKHRKTESASSQSQKSQSSSVDAGSSTDLRLHRGNSSDSTPSVIRDISYNQGVEEARKFRDVYYPQYAAEYDKQLAMEERGERVPQKDRERLWEMHRRIQTMKLEMRIASEREHFDES